MKFEKLIKKSRKLLPLCEQAGNRTFHFSFFLRRNKILASGYNRYKEGSRFAKENGFPWSFRHAEIDCLLCYRFRLEELKGTTLVNIRLSKCGEHLMLAKPCERCMFVLQEFDLSNIWYSTKNGFERFEI